MAARSSFPVAALAVLALAAPAVAAPVVVRSPDAGLVAEVDVVDGTPVLRATLDGAPILDASPLGLRLAGADLRTGLVAGAVTEGRVDERVRTTTGPERRRRLRANEALIRFDGGARPLAVRVRVADDGVGYRYELPGPATSLLEEAGGFAPAGVTESWLAPHTPNGEALWGGVSERTLFGTPGEHLMTALSRSGGGDRYVLLTEAGVDGGAAASRLVQSGSLFRYGLARRSETTALGPMESGGPLAVETTQDWHGPWRLAIAGTLAEVATSTLVADLSAPAHGRFGWVRPGVASWSWWSEHASPRSLDRQKAYVEFAAAHGWEYTTVDEGWEDLGEQGIAELAALAKERGVRLILWFNRRSLDTAAKRRERFDQLRALGVAGIKVDFFDDDTQATMRLVDDLLAEAAARRLVVNLHGFTVPRGLERRWPHLLSYEGVRGAEYYLFSQDYAGLVPAPSPTHNAILPFTRAVAGPVDYTPMTFTAPSRLTTPAHELALGVVLQTGMLHPADRIESYAARPAATALVDRLPVVWDDSRLLEGFPGSAATFARRHGPDWWVGSITAGAGRHVDVPLDFLGPGRFRARIAQDGGAADDVATREAGVTAADVLGFDVAEHGGFVVELRAAVRRCWRKRVAIALPPGARRVRVRVPGRPVAVLRGARRRVRVSLAGRSRRITVVRIAVRGADGRLRFVRRAYRPCR